MHGATRLTVIPLIDLPVGATCLLGPHRQIVPLHSALDGPSGPRQRGYTGQSLLVTRLVQSVRAAESGKREIMQCVFVAALSATVQGPRQPATHQRHHS